MTERQTPAIVLTVREYGEADLLVTFITPGQGRLTGIAKHARKSRRRFAHCLEPLSRVVFFLSPRTGRDLEFLQKGELVQSFPSLRRDLPRLGAAAVLSEVAGLLAGPPEAIGEIFASLEAALALLDQGLPPDSMLPAFLLRLLTLGGYGPRLGQCLKCGQEPAPPLWFSVPRGGVLCGACRPGGARSLAPSEPGDLEAVAPGPGDAAGETLPPPFPPAPAGSKPGCLQGLPVPSFGTGPQILVLLGEGDRKGTYLTAIWRDDLDEDLKLLPLPISDLSHLRHSGWWRFLCCS